MEMTTQAVACRWCKGPATMTDSDGWICNGCHAAEQIAYRYLRGIGKLSQDTMEKAMLNYLASRPKDADQPAPPEPRPFRVCPNCGAEAVTKPAWECWNCGYIGG